ncbi:MAG: hypothetical protein EOO27_13670 [Comamonadaceae bacterium]|nr:MAG: hypothetical protein EOO27_13670 [Comamonadaceae bacterium]
MAALLITRRTALCAFFAPAIAGMSGCTSPLPLNIRRPSAPDQVAAKRLLQSAQAHGIDAYRNLRDINVSYDGQWRPLINGIQPEVVDAGYRGSSQERLMPSLGINAQLYQGPRGSKKVFWRRTVVDAAGTEQADAAGEIAVWRNGVGIDSAPSLDAAALVAESYKLFLLGPLWLFDRGLSVRRVGTESVDGRACDVLEAWLSPGLGRALQDRIALCVDRDSSVMRRVRFTLEGFANTQGAVAEVDCFDHVRQYGVLWPTRSFERVLHPIGLPAHDWRLTGLDVNRGYTPQDLSGPAFEGAAAAPAAALSATLSG